MRVVAILITNRISLTERDGRDKKNHKENMKDEILIYPQLVYNQILTSKVIHTALWLISTRARRKHRARARHPHSCALSARVRCWRAHARAPATSGTGS